MFPDKTEFELTVSPATAKARLQDLGLPPSWSGLHAVSGAVVAISVRAEYTSTVATYFKVVQVEGRQPVETTAVLVDLEAVEQGVHVTVIRLDTFEQRIIEFVEAIKQALLTIPAPAGTP